MTTPDSLLGEPATVAAVAGALAVAGLVAGTLAGLLGVGGGMIIVPVVYQLCLLIRVDPGMAMRVAVATSLATIVPTAFASGRAHQARNAVDIEKVRQLGPPVVVGVMLGSQLAVRLRGGVLTALFGAMLLAIAVRMARTERAEPMPRQLRGTWSPALLGGTIGFLSGMLGLGGGSMIVPALHALRLPMHRAVGTSAVLGLIIALPGAIGFAIAGLGAEGRPPLSLGYINLVAFVVLSATTLVTAPLGARWAHSASGRTLRRLFACFLALVALRMLYALVP
jgi:uncharacterized membrane protein YfcA